MNDVVKTLSNIRSLRVLARDLELDALLAIQEKLNVVVAEKQAEQVELQRQEEERQNRIAKYKDLLAQEGITAAELAEILGTTETTVKVRAKREQRPAKYRYTDENGQVKTWTGQGRTPKAIQNALDAGKSLESFAI